uniref:Major facilitator superfamily (MFS) profile domain-containing protein n=1 Tax=Acrobeloides nanus TaxID=290746 RepID=A0A914D3S0_9BILA
MSVGGTLVVIFTYCIELVLPEQRLSLQVYANWGTARVILTLVCYFFPDWRHASFVCCLTSLPALLIIIFVYPESPMWLLTKENIEEFKKSQHRIQKISGEDLVELPQIEKQEKVTLKTLWSSSRVLIVFLTLCFSWFTVSVSNFALDLYSPSIIGDFFTNQFAFALILMASKFVMGVIDQAIPQFDRRMLHNYNQLIAAICFGVVAVLLVFNYENIFVLILSIIGLFTVEYTWDACYLVTVESMPTGIRSTALGICSTIARVGMMTAPLLVTLSSFWKPTVYTAMAIFGFVNVVSAWYFLPETKGVDLAEVNLEKSAKISPSESSISV